VNDYVYNVSSTPDRALPQGGDHNISHDFYPGPFSSNRKMSIPAQSPSPGHS
jgi:hypothetical protein